MTWCCVHNKPLLNFYIFSIFLGTTAGGMEYVDSLVLRFCADASIAANRFAFCMRRFVLVTSDLFPSGDGIVIQNGAPVLLE